MTVETGRVVRAENRQAIVEVKKNTDCARCHEGCTCHFGDNTIKIKADDPIGVQEDQIVSLKIPEGNVPLAAFIVYVVPLILLIAGILAGDSLGKRFGVDFLFEILGGIAGIGLSVPIIRHYDATFKRNLKQQPRITRIIHEAGA